MVLIIKTLFFVFMELIIKTYDRINNNFNKQLIVEQTFGRCAMGKYFKEQY